MFSREGNFHAGEPSSCFDAGFSQEIKSEDAGVMSIIELDVVRVVADGLHANHTRRLKFGVREDLKFIRCLRFRISLFAASRARANFCLLYTSPSPRD